MSVVGEPTISGEQLRDTTTNVKTDRRGNSKTRYRMKSLGTARGTCRVCLKYYNGVLACSECLSFHRSNVLRNRSLKCVKENEKPASCKVNFKSKPCEYCWHQKCTAKGLTKLTVKFSGRRYRKPILPAHSPNSVRAMSKAYYALFRSYDRKIKADHIKPLLLSDEPLEKGLSSYKASMFSQLCAFYQPLVNGIVQFSKGIPGFSKLPADDQLILLKTGFIDVWLILNSVRLTHVKDSITLHDGTQIPICEVTTVYTKEYVTSIMELSDESRNLHLSIPEKSTLIALALSCPERPNLLDKEQVKVLQTSLMESLKIFITLARPMEPERTEKVFNFLSNVSDIGKQHSLLLNVYRADVSKLSVTPVITELFDLHPPSSYKEA